MSVAVTPASLRTLALPEEVEHWSLTTLRKKLVKIGAKVIHHGRYVIFQLAEVAAPRDLFRKIRRPIDDLRPRPVPVLPAEINEEWHSKRRQVVKIGGARWLNKNKYYPNVAAVNVFVELEDYLEIVG